MKKAELTTQQIVILIIVILSFVILLFLLLKLNLGETTDKQICHNSVILKSKTSGLKGNLDCKTNYICISGGGKCKDFNPAETIPVDSTDKNQVYKILAKEMADCWWMFSEGEVDYTSWEILDKYHCAICSIIKFDSEIQKLELTYKDFYTYLEGADKDEGQTYLQYLYGVNKQTLLGNLKDFSINLDESIDFSQKHKIVTGLKDKDEFIHSYFVESDRVKEQTLCQVFDISRA